MHINHQSGPVCLVTTCWTVLGRGVEAGGHGLCLSGSPVWEGNRMKVALEQDEAV